MNINHKHWSPNSWKLLANKFLSKQPRSLSWYVGYCFFWNLNLLTSAPPAAALTSSSGEGWRLLWEPRWMRTPLRRRIKSCVSDLKVRLELPAGQLMPRPHGPHLQRACWNHLQTVPTKSRAWKKSEQFLQIMFYEKDCKSADVRKDWDYPAVLWVSVLLFGIWKKCSVVYRMKQKCSQTHKQASLYTHEKPAKSTILVNFFHLRRM